MPFLFVGVFPFYINAMQTEKFCSFSSFLCIQIKKGLKQKIPWSMFSLKNATSAQYLISIKYWMWHVIYVILFILAVMESWSCPTLGIAPFCSLKSNRPVMEWIMKLCGLALLLHELFFVLHPHFSGIFSLIYCRLLFIYHPSIEHERTQYNTL